jgi:hypothetical protein
VENRHREVAPTRVAFVVVGETIRRGGDFTEAFPDPCAFARLEAPRGVPDNPPLRCRAAAVASHRIAGFEAEPSRRLFLGNPALGSSSLPASARARSGSRARRNTPRSVKSSLRTSGEAARTPAFNSSGVMWGFYPTSRHWQAALTSSPPPASRRIPSRIARRFCLEGCSLCWCRKKAGAALAGAGAFRCRERREAGRWLPMWGSPSKG